MGEAAQGAGVLGEGALARHLAGQLTAVLARPDEAEMQNALAAAGEVWRSLAPADPLEQMLTVQMIAAHEAALDGHARAKAIDGVADPQRERARRAELGLAARFSNLFTRQAALLTRRRAAAERRAEKARKDGARAAARETAAAAAERPRGGVLVVPPVPLRPGEPEPPWPDPEALAAALARKRAEDDAPATAASVPASAPGAAPAPGYLVVPGKLPPEEWSRRARAYYRRMEAEGLMPERDGD
jgi:hypothetical protein